MRQSRFVDTTHRALWILLVTACSTATSPTPQLDRELRQVAAAYAAKVTASALFVSGRSIESVRTEELSPHGAVEQLVAPHLQIVVDREQRTITCRVGDAHATAADTGALGCALVRADADLATLRRHVPQPVAMPPRELPWPRGDQFDEAARRATGADFAALERAVDRAFADPGDGRRVHTRAVVVVHRGQLLIERYAAGIDAHTPLPGWSMSKTVTGALVGMRIADGAFDLEQELPRAAGEAGDAEPATARELLTMTAGRAWNESYTAPDSDALRMLFDSTHHAAVYRRQPRAHPPGSHFCYASGASNLLCELLREGYRDQAAYWALPRRLFARLGMRSAVFETDPGGTFVGSSYVFASARDWARFGMLYLQDGVFAGDRVLPADWVRRSAEPTRASGGRFGMHLWLNRDPDGDGPATRDWPELPSDVVHMDGHQGQYVLIAPSHELVVVRLGCTKTGGFDVRALLHAALAAVS